MNIISSLNKINIYPTQQQLWSCDKLIEEHLKWNKIFNLSAHRCFNDVLNNQLLDSLSVSKFIRSGRLLDIGTGPGFPGLPLAVFHPNTQFTLLDANDKKLAFARHMKSLLSLKNVSIVHERIEKLSVDSLFNQIISRAFTDLNDMIQCSLPRLFPGGEILAMKGSRAKDELADAKVTHNSCTMRLEKLPSLINKERVLAIVRQGIQ